MATIDSQVLFLTTSPRTPNKMIPEISLLVENFEGESWNKVTQIRYMDILREEQFFNGSATNDPAFSARDRINRAPKALGFVKLSPKIELTPAGFALINAKTPEEIFLRQFLKFQVPSPYHKPTSKAANFWIKPYLEMLRLVRVMGTLKFDELHIFGMQLTNWNDFDKIVAKIKKYRNDKAINSDSNALSYREFKSRYLIEELKEVYSSRILSGNTKTRESADKSLDNFLRTQASNMRDYADACFRYLRATGLVNVSYVGKSLSIIPERIDDVDYILENIDRNPCFIDDLEQYETYLGDVNQPRLFTDNREIILQRLKNEFSDVYIDANASIESLKQILAEQFDKRKQDIINQQITDIKDYKLYDDIQNTFGQIMSGDLYDAPLILEWNTWRAMTMLDGGNIKANLNFDDFGKPLSTASGNMPDIVCDYDEYMLSVEVTMSSGQRQYDMEGEPVSRHLGKLKNSSEKPSYGLFIAPKINEATIAHFFMLHHINVSYYGGRSVIVPLPLCVFQKMLEDSYKSDYIPTPAHVRNFFEMSMKIAHSGVDEITWFEKMKEHAINWL